MRKLLLPSLLSGVLLGITTIGNGPVYHLHWAIFFGFVPLWASWQREEKARNIFLSGWITQSVFTLVAFHWLAYTVNEFSHMGLVLSTIVLLLYCAIANLQFPLAGLLWHYLFRLRLPPWAGCLALAALTALLQRLGTTIFHWNFGYAWLYMGWPAIQLADIFGFRFLCTISILLNALLLLAWLGRAKRGWMAPFALAVATFALMNGLGSWRHRSLPLPDAIAQVLVVQPNIGNREKEKLEHGEEKFRQEILGRYIRQTEEALRSGARPTFALWPENAFPAILADSELKLGLAPLLREFVVKNNLTLLTGAFGMDSSEKITNSLFAISADGKWAGEPYQKMHLLPFGEYVPGATRFPALRSWFPDVRDYGWGEKPVLLEINYGTGGKLRLGPQICYEGLFDSVSRDLALLDAQILVNVTNDSWYGDWMEPWQHFYITMAKAVETRRPLVRGTNTGLSGLILADGQLAELSPISRPWTKLYEVPYHKNPPSPPFLGWGFYFDWAFLIVVLSLLAFAARKRRHSARDANQ
jgi:apolipoprotein N-acyltransferase